MAMAAPLPSPHPPPELMDELMEEILLRVPPDDPACLARAALVCKRWCRLIMDPGFRRRFRQFHRTPPLLGFVLKRHSRGPYFLPSSSFRPPSDEVADCCSYFLLDARHGRVLLCYVHDHDDDDPDYFDPDCVTIASKELIFWTPVTGQALRLPNLWLRKSCYDTLAMAAVLLCGEPGCNHMECEWPAYGPLSVILVCGDNLGHFAYAYVYSTEADNGNEWSETATIELPGFCVQSWPRPALARNALYFLLKDNRGILEYNLSKKELSVIGLPPICNESITSIVPMTVEDDGLGFAMLHDFSLCIWLRESVPTPSSGWTWLQHRVVDIRSFLPFSPLTSTPYVVAAADAVGVFVI